LERERERARGMDREGSRSVTERGERREGEYISVTRGFEGEAAGGQERQRRSRRRYVEEAESMRICSGKISVGGTVAVGWTDQTVERISVTWMRLLLEELSLLLQVKLNRRVYVLIYDGRYIQ
jgi:hypothetical protein